MQKYSDYKDSGIEWIGNVPQNWNLKKIKWLSPVRRGASPRPIDDEKYFDSNGEYSWVRIADVSACERYLEKTTQTLSELGASLSVKMQPGSFFLSIAGTVGKPIITKIKCCIHDGFVWFPDLKINPEYLYYIFMTGLPYKGLGKLGTQLNLNTETVGDIVIPLPTGSEIELIVKYLDHKVILIEKLISDKEKLIELLNEECAALINQAVTKGLNHDLPLVDSGIEWLGQIPMHWNLKRIKHLNKKIGSGVTPKGGAEVYEDEGILFLRSQNIYFEGFKLDNVAHISEQVHTSMANSKVYSNDVLLNITGGSIGRCFYVTGEFAEANVNQHVCIIRPNEKILTVYLYNLLRSFVGQLQIDNCQIGGNRESVNFEQLKNFIFPIPDIEEQEEILSYLSIQENRIITLISALEKEIQLLKEYRTSLISEAVTGKIDVQDEVTTESLATE